jgi:predicted transcriptional regulator/transcriptional regulator with XRE-family HTH domain
MAERKVMVGPRVRRMRLERGLTQKQMAEELGISTSYLNLIERNQRPVTVQLLLKLGQSYDIDLQRFAVDDEARVAALLKEVFGDPLFARSGVTNQDIQDMAAASPMGGEAVFALFRAYRELVDNALNMAEGLSDNDKLGGPAALRLAGEEMQDFIQARDNYFPDLEDAADQLWREAKLDKEALYESLRAHLLNTHSIKVRVLPFDVMEDTLRRYDRHGRRVMLSEILSAESRTYQLAYQIALLDRAELIDEIVDSSGLEGGETRRLLRIGLANYMAGAVIMPYTRFHEAVKALRYDIDLLAQRFGAGYEQVCNRLTSLQRPGDKGVPLFLVRMDCAGNVSRRLSANGFHFARFGGLCPRWGVHRAFRTPGETRTEFVQMPDGGTFFSVARLVARPGGGHRVPAQQFVVAIGCEASHAGQMIYADGKLPADADAALKIGVNCRLCDRLECNRRAYPPLNRRLVVDENHLGLAPYFFT